MKGRRGKKGEKPGKATKLIKLSPEVKEKLLDWMTDHALDSFNQTVGILLEVAEKCEKEMTIEIVTKPSVTVNGG